MIHETDVLILGGGLAGLSAGVGLGKRGLVLEREARPGGLVRTERFGDYWFDRVLHLLYFPDVATQQRIVDLLGPHLVRCPPCAWVESKDGIARFPVQLHLGALQEEAVIRCLRDFARVTFTPSATPPKNYEEMLRQTFGEALCETFFFPYNRKMWRRPLADLAPTSFQWNIARPSFDDVLRGVLAPTRPARTYNGDGWYPHPTPGSPVRGMELLSHTLAQQVPRLLLDHTVENIDLPTRTITARHQGQAVQFRFRHRCLSTLPLPRVIDLCRPVPTALREACRSLVHNRVLSAAFSIRGPRPVGRGHWRYFPDETLIFTRLIYMHEFDPDAAPMDGWGLLAEIPQAAERAARPEAILAQARADIVRVGALPSDCAIVDQHLMIADPAYVVFTPRSQAIVQQARAFLAEHGIDALGRYGRWEYSSMGQVLRDGFAWSEQVQASLP